jgi:antitoxin MazE
MTKTATISRWGNAQGIRLPQSFCHQLGISVGDKVELSIEKNKLVIARSVERYTLKERMKSWSGGRYQTHEYDWGEPVGKEDW